MSEHRGIQETISKIIKKILLEQDYWVCKQLCQKVWSLWIHETKKPPSITSTANKSERNNSTS